MVISRTLVQGEQFEIDDYGITHKPTGYNFTPYPGDPTSGTVNKGRLGDKLETGEDFRPHEVEEMAWRLWVQYCQTRWPRR
jgi:hypothetical protein